MGSCSEGRTALASILIDINNVDELESQGHKKGSDFSFNVSSWRMNPPLLCCWKKLLISIDSNDYIPRYAIQAVDALSSGSLSLCLDGSRLGLFLSYLATLIIQILGVCKLSLCMLIVSIYFVTWRVYVYFLTL